MNKKLITAATLSTLIAAGGIVGSVSAQTAATATGLTEAEVIEIALTEVPGEVVEVEFETENGDDIYEIEILTADGEEIEVEIDANTGEVLEIEEERDHDCGHGKRASQENGTRGE